MKMTMMKNRILMVILIALACSPAFASGPVHPQSKELATALSSMMDQPSDGFLIVEIPNRTQYFQFSSVDKGYIFDVPVMALSSRQKVTATRFFKQEGIALINVPFTDSDTIKDAEMKTYQKEFGATQTESGANLGFRFMAEVLNYAGEVQITRGWE